MGLLATGRVGVVDNIQHDGPESGWRTQAFVSLEASKAVTFRDERLANLSLQPTAPAEIVRRRG